MKKLMMICVVAVFMLAVSSPAMGALISYWPFDEGDSDTAYDSIGTDDGTVEGATWITGVIGGALEFDGVDDYVDLGTTGLFEGGTAATIAFWAKPEVSTERWPCTFAKWTGYSYYEAPAVGIHSPTNTWFWEVTKDPGISGTNVYRDSSVSVDYGVWQHIAYVFDFTLNEVRLYKNGELAQSWNVDIGDRMASGTNTAIGGVVRTNVRHFFKGALDEMAIWSHVLSTEDVMEVYENGVIICIAIKDQILTYADDHYLAGTLLPQGTDIFGYNYHTHLFRGYYANVYLGGYGYPPYDGDGGDYFQLLVDEGYATTLAEAEELMAGVWCWPYRDIDLTMKWNDAWISNQDCDAYGRLDRHWGFDSYIGSGAWETNQQSGIDVDPDTSEESHWTYFCKIIAVPADADLVDGVWYTADNVEIGPDIWGQFAITQEVSSGSGQTYLSLAYPGLGNITSEMMGPDEE